MAATKKKPVDDEKVFEEAFEKVTAKKAAAESEKKAAAEKAAKKKQADEKAAAVAAEEKAEKKRAAELKQEEEDLEEIRELNRKQRAAGLLATEVHSDVFVAGVDLDGEAFDEKVGEVHAAGGKARLKVDGVFAQEDLHALISVLNGAFQVVS